MVLSAGVGGSSQQRHGWRATVHRHRSALALLIVLLALLIVLLIPGKASAGPFAGPGFAGAATAGLTS
jgi:hypothetical protein